MVLSNVVYVLDASAILHTNTLQIFDRPCYTTPRVTQEVLDDKSRTILEVTIIQRRLAIVEPSEEYLKRATNAAKATGDILRLSDVDIEVIALALQIKDQGLEPVVITDDYAIMNVLRYLGIQYRPLRTRGIREYRKWLIYCPACGKVFHEKRDVCDNCGSPLIKRKIVKRKRVHGAGGGI